MSGRTEGRNPDYAVHSPVATQNLSSPKQTRKSRGIAVARRYSRHETLSRFSVRSPSGPVLPSSWHSPRTDVAPQLVGMARGTSSAAIRRRATDIRHYTTSKPGNSPRNECLEFVSGVASPNPLRKQTQTLRKTLTFFLECSNPSSVSPTAACESTDRPTAKAHSQYAGKLGNPQQRVQFIISSTRYR